MAWPPPALPITRTNATPQFDTHAQDHNAVNLAVNDLVSKVSWLDATVVDRGVQKSWTPAWVAGGVAVPHTTVLATYMQFGQMRIGMCVLQATGAVAAGGMLIGDGFWGTGGVYSGWFEYLDLGAVIYTGTTGPYDDVSSRLQVNNQNNLFGITPSIAVAVGDTLRASWVAYSFGFPQPALLDDDGET
jgi:hypothetical protein